MKGSLLPRIVVPFLLFVVIGSIGLTQWLHHEWVRTSRAQFAEMAKVNAEFIQASRLAPSERTARDLGKILGCEVSFRQEEKTGGTQFVAAPPGKEAIETVIHPGLTLLLVRDSSEQIARFFHPSTFAVLLVFWTLSLALGASVASGIVRPIRSLSRFLPQIGMGAPFRIPESSRRDEIGSLARAFEEANEKLAVERASREKAERLAILGRMSTGLAHEIHNPLSAIRMHLQMIEPDPETSESIEVALNETKKIERLINQWLFMARPETPQLRLTPLLLPLEMALRSYHPMANYAGVRIELLVSETLVVEMDERRIEQALANLIINAIQAMPSGGRLTIRGTIKNDRVELQFLDSGRGFSDAALAGLPQLFYSEKEGGMGIGLCVVSEILKAHGGNLELANRPEGGACVTVILPLPNLCHPAIS